MSNLTIRFYSNCLRRYTTFKMYLPCDIRQDWGQTDTKYSENSTKTLFLLHGYTGDAENWVPEYLSDKYNFAVVIPSGENSFWLDGRSTGHQFCKFVGEEFVDYVRRVFRLAKDGSETYIMGLSMGGFGALHTAFAYPETFGKVAALSSALIVHEVAGMSEGQGNATANYEYYRECFGETSEVLNSRNNPEFLIDELQREGKNIPDIFMCCGTEDFLLENNRDLHKFLESRNVSHEYYESKGNHDMIFWSEYAEKAVKWMFEEK